MYCVSCDVRIEFICYVDESGPPLWSSGQSSRLQIQRSGFDSQCYQIFWEVVGPELGPLSLVSVIEELLEIKSSFSGLENRDYGRRDPSRWPRGTFYAQNLALSSPTSSGRSVGIVLSRIQGKEFNSFLYRDNSSNPPRRLTEWEGLPKAGPTHTVGVAEAMEAHIMLRRHPDLSR
jgi:hypothetical protein